MTIPELHTISFQRIDISRIHDTAGPFCMSFGFNAAALARSIEQIGLVNPPVLITEKENNYHVVAGFRRIAALKSLGWTQCQCRVLSSEDCSPLGCFLINLYDNLSVRSFNEVEKAMVVSRLSAWVERDQLRKQYLPLLKISSRDANVDFYIKMENELEEEMKASIVQGRLSMHAVAGLLEMDSGTRLAVFRMISGVVLNVNQQKQFLEYISDMAHARRMRIEEVLDQDDIRKICDDSRMNNPQKADALLKVLRSSLFPRLTSAEQTFHKTISAIKFPAGVRIMAPPFFEAPYYKMEVLFKSGKELVQKIQDLSHAQGLLKIEDPWEKG